MRLNNSQQQAVDYVDGPTLVLAGAGSGKTRVITNKIVNLLNRHNLLPSKICALTFTNKAAAEMKQRVTTEVGTDVAKELTICTFHSLGLNILRREHQKLNLGANFTLFDQFDGFKIIRDITREHFPQLTIDVSEKSVIQDIASQISIWKSQLLSPQDLSQNSPFVKIYDLYQKYLRACNAVDFEDLIFVTSCLLKNDPEVRNRWNHMFRYILVDEYQDTNETQYQLLKILTEIYKCFTVVGDDDQSIYSWRGARPENIKTLTDDFPNLKVIMLEQNYRSTPNILACANSLIGHNPHLYNKKLYNLQKFKGSIIRIIELPDEASESERVAAEILGNKFKTHRKWSDYAVLYRGNFQSRSLEKAFRESRIPCVITGGSSFFEQMEIKDMLAWFRVLCNPDDDVALLRIINVPRRGIGAETIACLTEAGKLTGRSIFQNTLNENVTKKLKQQQKQALTDFIRVFLKLHSRIDNDRGLWIIDNILEETGYEAYLQTGSESKAVTEIRIKNVKQLLDWVRKLIIGKKDEDPLSFTAAIDKLGLREMLDRQDNGQDQDAVQLMTLHAAKGLEFPFVALVGFEEGILPHHSSYELEHGIEEERRLAYVGVTRAKEDLIITFCQKRKRQSQVDSIVEGEQHHGPSRFLDEMPKELLQISKGGEWNISNEDKEENIDLVLSEMLKLL